MSLQTADIGSPFELSWDFFFFFFFFMGIYRVETTIVNWGFIWIMEKKMTAAIVIIFDVLQVSSVEPKLTFSQKRQHSLQVTRYFMTTNNELGLRESDVLAMCDINASSKS